MFCPWKTPTVNHRFHSTCIAHRRVVDRVPTRIWHLKRREAGHARKRHTVAEQEGSVMPCSCHVVVTVHGMWGRPSHTESLATEIAARGFIVMNSRANSGLGTYDGIEVCAARLCTEVRDFIHNTRQNAATRGTNPPSSLSFVGYSAGGLFARAAAAQLGPGLAAN